MKLGRRALHCKQFVLPRGTRWMNRRVARSAVVHPATPLPSERRNVPWSETDDMSAHTYVSCTDSAWAPRHIPGETHAIAGMPCRPARATLWNGSRPSNATFDGRLKHPDTRPIDSVQTPQHGSSHPRKQYQPRFIRYEPGTKSRQPKSCRILRWQWRPELFARDQGFMTRTTFHRETDEYGHDQQHQGILQQQPGNDGDRQRLLDG